MELSDDEVQIIKELIEDYGSDCPWLASDRLRPLAEKLGVWEPESPPTPEELARREAFRNSPAGKAIAEMFAITNRYMAKFAEEMMKDNVFMSVEQWGNKIGSQLHVRLPNDYVVTPRIESDKS